MGKSVVMVWEEGVGDTGLLENIEGDMCARSLWVCRGHT